MRSWILALLAASLSAQPLPDIRWQFGPRTLTLAGVAELRLNMGLMYVDGAEMRKFLLASGNTLTGRELAVAGPVDLAWFAVISREPGAASHVLGSDITWTETNREPDGRDVVVDSFLTGGNGAVLRFELVTEAASHQTSRAAFDHMRASFRFLPSATRPAWNDWRLWAAVLVSLALAILTLRRRPTSS